MRLLFLVYKNETVFFVLISSLFLWGLLASILAFQNKEKVILIGTVNGSYKVINDREMDPLETENFIRHFLGLTLNFNEANYRKHISIAGDLMTESLWLEKKKEFKEMAGFIKKHQVVQSSEVLSITRKKKNLFEVKVKNYLFKKGVLREKENLISLSLIKNERSYENPWRHSVSNVEVK